MFKLNPALCVLSICVFVVLVVNGNDVEECEISDELKREIASYATSANLIINSVVSGANSGTTYKRLSDFIDKFGSRMAGSKNLENAIDYMLDQSKKFGLENVHGEEVTVPHWVRGEESATLLSPRRQALSVLGLGGSVTTPSMGLVAKAVVVRSFRELKKVSKKVRGKIVVFNQKFVNYGVSVVYRVRAASTAAQYGAVATLVRSITPFSLYTPHTGWQTYDQNVTKKIPTACITVEDARMLQRMQNRGDSLVIKLRMDSAMLPPAKSRNTVAEIVGTTLPEKIVVSSGHLDSWDVGQGAMDDGGGAFLAWNSLVVLKNLGLRPKRTIRAILWTAEEEGLLGAAAYAERHKNETKNFDFMMESDGGTFSPQGLEFSGTPVTACIFKEILKLFSSINTTQLKEPCDGAPDLTFWIKQGIPTASLLNDAKQYFWYHHTNADTMDVENPVSLDKSTALWATVAYIVADLSIDLPRITTGKNP